MAGGVGFARLFLTADGEKDKALGTRRSAGTPRGWLEVKLPAPLAHLANRPHAATGCRARAVLLPRTRCRPDGDAARPLRHQPRPGTRQVVPRRVSGRPLLPRPRRWTSSGSPVMRSTSTPAPRRRVAAADVTSWAPRPPSRCTWPGCPPPPGTGGCGRHHRSDRHREEHGARAIVIEDLDFAEARSQGRERRGNRPSRGLRGRAFRRLVAGIPTGLRGPLIQMAANAGCTLIVVDPLTPPGGGPSTGSARCASITPSDRAPRGSAGDRATRTRPPARRRAAGTAPPRGATASPGATPDHPVTTPPRKPATPRAPQPPAPRPAGPTETRNQAPRPSPPANISC